MVSEFIHTREAPSREINSSLSGSPVTLLEAAHQQRHELEERLGASNPQLYRHLALYLQVLRDGLLGAVQQACFHVATQVHPDRYADLPQSQRLVLHRRMANPHPE